MHTPPNQPREDAHPRVAPEEDILCPFCDYDLSGLDDPPCPECGYSFTWDEVLDPARRRHPYLFENHPERNVWSFLATLRNAQRPTRFWNSLHLTQPSRPRRLFLYWCIVNGTLVVAMLLGVGFSVLTYAKARADRNAFAQRWQLSRQSASIAQSQPAASPPAALQQYLAATYPTDPWTVLRQPQFCSFALSVIKSSAVAVLAVAIVWPWLTWIVLMIFHGSMKRGGVRPLNVARCIVYTSDLGIWAAMIVLPITAFQRQMPPIDRLLAYPIYALGELVLRQPAGVAALLLLVIWLYRLSVAMRCYLRIDRPIRTIVASQAILLVLVGNVAAIALLK